MSYGRYFAFRLALGEAYLGVDIHIRGDGPWPPPSDPDDALWKLVNYADNEGVFGPPMTKRVAARLAALDHSALGDEWVSGLLSEWTAVFVAAAQHEDGCVERS